MRTDDFDFELPDDRIALRAAEPRDSARLLNVSPDGIEDCRVTDLPTLLRRGDVLVFNNTRVIPSALTGIRHRGAAVARIQVNLHKRVDASRWNAFARPARKLTVGEEIVFAGDFSGNDPGKVELRAVVSQKFDAGEIELAFEKSGPALDEAVARIGEMPLPPYIASRRATDASDNEAYQTVYAERDGAVAAPTAGLHFTDSLFASLREAGVGLEFLTLHVGAGTFLPVKADAVEAHHMHSEWGEVTAAVADTLNNARDAGGRLIAVGTTVTRLLESAVDANGRIQPFNGDTDIFIKPGDTFHAVDAMWTNFHLPRSTLFMLVAAFAGLERMQGAYRHAIDNNYRFYSYGDASLLWPTAAASGAGNRLAR